MLCTALRYHGVDDPRLYKTCHLNHPASIWARQTGINFSWLLVHFEALLDECKKRPRKDGTYPKDHASTRLIPLFYKYIHVLPKGDLTPFVNCAANNDVGVSFKDEKDVIKAYNLYLEKRWMLDKLTPTWYGKAYD
jgi:hypothetical protein